MERLNERLASAFKALITLEELSGMEKPSQIIRDATLQRFEYTFEIAWKTAKTYLYEIEGVVAGSPKNVIRECLKVGIFDSQETTEALIMVDDRNLTVHTYNETLSLSIYSRITVYAPLIRKWLERIETRVNS